MTPQNNIDSSGHYTVKPVIKIKVDVTINKRYTAECLYDLFSLNEQLKRAGFSAKGITQGDEIKISYEKEVK